MLALLAILTAGVLYFVVGQLDSAAVQRTRDKVTTQALAQAKAALIGWSASRGGAGNPRPGELPCPDTNAPETLNSGNESGSCSSGAIGRLPWKTLGIEELKDGYGETLWYAIDGPFRKRPANENPINSDTRASMLAYGSDGVTLLTPPGSEAVAIIFSPGPIIGVQSRSNPTEQTTASNYLDTVGPPDIPIARSNATTHGPFTQGMVKDSSGNVILNDRLLVVTANELMAIVEKRVAKELTSLLTNYFVANGFYPYPAKYNDLDCLDVGSSGYFTSCYSDPSVCRGRVPIDELSSVPVWLFYNLWGQVAYYAVSTDKLASVPASCLPSATVVVDGAPVSGLLFTPGTPLGPILRNAPQSIQLGDYLEDAMNQDGWTVSASNQYCTPGSLACLPTPGMSNDRLFILP